VTSDPRTSFTGSIPEFYDRCLGPAWFGPAAMELVKRVPADPNGDVLEIACGTGLITREIRKRLSPTRKLVATDLNKPMLDFARDKLSGVEGIEYREADALNLPFGDAEFAVVVCGLGLMFVPDRKRALAEMRRVTRQGGCIVLSTWDAIEENTYAKVYAETIESLFPNDPEVRFRLPWELHDEKVLRDLLSSSGYKDIEIVKNRMPVGGDPRTIATGQVRGTPRGNLLEKKGMSMEEAIDRVTAAIETMREPGYATVIITRARRA
jgi:SAM-dependent methyltransferase